MLWHWSHRCRECADSGLSSDRAAPDDPLTLGINRLAYAVDRVAERGAQTAFPDERLGAMGGAAESRAGARRARLGCAGG
jgi:hypothetical protein